MERAIDKGREEFEAPSAKEREGTEKQGKVRWRRKGGLWELTTSRPNPEG